MKKLLIILLFGFYGGLIAQENPLETPIIGVQIALGDTVNINGVSINFAEVLEDSRCPKNVTCVWEGRVRIKIIVTYPDGKTKEQGLIFGRIVQNEPSENVIYSNPELTIKGLAVTPYPIEAGEKLDYCLIVDVKD